MKMSLRTCSMLIALAVTTTGASAFAADKCEMVLRGINEGYEVGTKWRAASTNEVSGTIVPTTWLREETIMNEQKRMDELVQNGITPIWNVVFSPDVYFTRTQYGQYQTGKYPKFNVSTDGEATLRATLFLPVSAHVGIDNARSWSKSDTYTIWAEVDGVKTYLVKDVKSLDLITLQDIAIPLVKDKEVLIFYQRSGNSIYGYIEGRKMGFTWDGY